MCVKNPYVQYMYSYPHKTAYGTLSGVRLEDWLGALKKQENSLYFHIPFCQYKCGYCNLFSVTGQNMEYMERYFDALERQAEQIATKLPSGVEFSSLDVGGGTPLILPEKLLLKIFQIAGDYFGFDSEKYPVVVETSPNQTDSDKLQILKENNTTRISIGVQSFIEDELKTLNRCHLVKTAREALSKIGKLNFPCVNIDLIYGIPKQSKETLLYSLEQAMEYVPQEMFVYPLYVKPETYLYRNGVHINPETAGLYDAACDFLLEKRYRQDSMRRFVKVESEQELTNLPDGRCGFSNTLSLGCGGRSYIGNLHFCTPYSIRQVECLNRLETYMETYDYLQITNGFILTKEEQKRRYVIRHLLYGAGISFAEYKDGFNCSDVTKDFPVLCEWENNGYVISTDTHIRLTKDGRRLSDYIGPQLISDDVAGRMREYNRRTETNGLAKESYIDG